MAAAFDPTDPRRLTSQQRLDALAAVLAKGAGRVLALTPSYTREEGAGAVMARVARAGRLAGLGSAAQVRRDL